MKSKALLIFIFTLFLALNIFGQQANSIVSTQESITKRLKLAPCESKERLEFDKISNIQKMTKLKK